MQGFVSLLGRALLVAIFVVSAIMGGILDFSNSAQMMGQQRIPAPKVMLVGAIAFLLLGSLSLILGCKARWGAALLAIFLALATYFFHDFWDIQNMADAHDQEAHFLKNLSMFGAMLFVIANGAGAWSIDACCLRRRSEDAKSQPG